MLNFVYVCKDLISQLAYMFVASAPGRGEQFVLLLHIGQAEDDGRLRQLLRSSGRLRLAHPHGLLQPGSPGQGRSRRRSGPAAPLQ